MKRPIILAVLALAACGDPPKPEVVLVESEVRVASLPDECKPNNDPKWSQMPDSDIDKKTIARVTKRNEANFSEVSGKRRVCWKAIEAQN